MTTTVIGLFDSADKADRARKALAESGCPEDAISIFGPDQGRDAVLRGLSEREIDQEEADIFASAIAKGAAVLAADIDDDQTDDIVSTLQKHGVRGVDEHPQKGGQQQQQGKRETQTLREVEEDVEIGKRRVMRGGVRVQSRVTERPVEETVSLKEEHVDVQHRDVSRELSPEEAKKAFQEKEIEVTETGEEAEVRKAARMIGEVEVGKTTQERQETVKETARKTEVEVEKVEPGQRGESAKKK